MKWLISFIIVIALLATCDYHFTKHSGGEYKPKEPYYGN